MFFLVIISLKVILFYPIQTKTLLLNLLLKCSNQIQILLSKVIFLKIIPLKNFLLKIILSKVKPNKPNFQCIECYALKTSKLSIFKTLTNALANKTLFINLMDNTYSTSAWIALLLVAHALNFVLTINWQIGLRKMQDC